MKARNLLIEISTKQFRHNLVVLSLHGEGQCIAWMGDLIVR